MDQVLARPRGSGERPLELPATARIEVAMVSTLPPRQCGIATFAANLCGAIGSSGAPIDLQFVAVERRNPESAPRSDVRWQISQGDLSSFLDVAGALNRSNVDVVCVEHEFGLYGAGEAEYRDHLAPFLAALRPPAVTTFHTVLPAPPPAIRAALREIAAQSAAIVVMTRSAARLLAAVYGVDPSKVHVIPHGVPSMAHGDLRLLRERFGLEGRTVVSTFGLVDPRKGLEFMVEAMESVVARHPDAIYIILGRTHPELLAHEGEQYRDSLKATVERRGLGAHVRFVDEYLSEQEIVDYLAVSDVYVTPYLDPDQITSGTLAYALGAGKAVVSTAYLHAVEALAGDGGLLVGFRSASALAAAVRRIIEEPGLRQRLEANAYAAGRQAAWPNVACLVSALLQAVAASHRPGAAPPAAPVRQFAALGSGGRQ